MTLWFELKASRIISVPTRTCHLSSETLESPVLPHPPDPRTRTHTRGITNATFPSLFFLPRPPTSLPAPIDPDRPQTKGGNADSYSQRFIQGARTGSPTAAPPQTRDVSWRRNLTSSRLERANAARCQSAQLASGRTFLHARVQ